MVAQPEATDAFPMPAGNVQLLIVPGSLTMSTQRQIPPGAHGVELLPFPDG